MDMMPRRLKAAPSSSSLLIPYAPQSSSDQDANSGASNCSVGAELGGSRSIEEGVGSALEMGWDVEEQTIRPPHSASSSLQAGSSLQGCQAEGGVDRKRSQGGRDSARALDAAAVQHQHVYDRISRQQGARDRPASVSSTPRGNDSTCNLGVEEKRGSSADELWKETGVGDLATPLASAGAGDVGAENDATPLQSRPPRGGFTLDSIPTSTSAGGGGSEDDSEETPKSGTEGSSGEGGEVQTWESFMANRTEADGTGGVEGGANGVPVFSRAGSSSTAAFQLPREASREGSTAEGHSRPVIGGSEQPSVDRNRHPRTMASNAGAVLWNNPTGDRDEEGDGGSVGETASVELPELMEGRPISCSSAPRLLSDLSGRAFSPRSRQIDIGRSQSLSSVGVGIISDLRKTTERGINKFNMDPKDGLAFLVDNELMADTAEGICDFLSTAEGLSKRRLGEYFGRDDPKAQQVLRLFLKQLKFKNASLDEALRSMVVRFRLPGEAQQMDRVMEAFAARYHEENPGVFSCSDTAWVLAFGLMMLNTDMYNRNIKEGEKMTEAQFVRNHRGIDQGKDPPKELLEGMYRRIKESEIRMDEGDMYESEVITFVAPKRSGWLKKKSAGYVGKWKRHWFVLNDAVLYYFITPQHQNEAPRCIIPLEGISITPIGATDLSIGSRKNQGYVKSVKMVENGTMQQGQHRSFVLRAESVEERDMWVEALRAELPPVHMEVSVSRSLSATPSTSSGPTPLGTPSASGRRSNKFTSSGRDRMRRATVDSEAHGQISRPVIRGWARTESDQLEYSHGGRRYIALFKNAGPDLKENVIYFFGDAAMCDKMINHHVRTSHGCLTMSDVTRVQLRRESGGERKIALQTGTGMCVKETVILPEEQREYGLWAKHIKECCPSGAYNVSANDTPVTTTIGDPTFHSVDSNGDGIVSSVSHAIGDGVDLCDDHFVSVGLPSSTASVAGTVDSKGQDTGTESNVYGRSESSETQPMNAGRLDGGSGEVSETNRVATTAPMLETKVESQIDPNIGKARAGTDLAETSRVVLTTETVEDNSTSPDTDVE